jgi:hypothetical protein
MEKAETMNGWLEYRAGFKYQLTSNYSKQTEILGFDIDTAYIKLASDGLLTLKCGYATDGPSSLTIDTRNSIRAAFVHDALYYLIRNGYLDQEWKKYADKLFYEILLEDGMEKPRAYIWYCGVRWKGAEALYPSKEKPVLRAP